MKKDLRHELEKEVNQQITIQIREEQDVEKRKELARSKKEKIQDQVKKRFPTYLKEQLEKFQKTEEIEYNRQLKEVDFLYPLIRAKRIRKVCPPQIPHKFLVNMVQLRKFISFDEILRKAQQTQEQKHIPSIISKAHLRKRLKQTEKWLDHIKEKIENTTDLEEKAKFESKVDIFEVPETVLKSTIEQLTIEQRESLADLYEWLRQIE